jgi:putative ABC transport system permease protein
MRWFFRVALVILTGFRNIVRNGLRSSLTLLGIIAGIATIIASTSIGQGAKSIVEAQMATYGNNVIVIGTAARNERGVRVAPGKGASLTVADAEELKRKVFLLEDTCWWRQDPNQVVYGKRNWYARVQGVSPSCIFLRRWSFTSGGPFTQLDMQRNSQVALVGATIAEYLFEPDQDPVGAMIRIKNVPFRVVGVLSPKGLAAAGNDQDDIILIPFTTAQRRVNGSRFPETVEAIYTATARQEDLDAAVQDIHDTLGSRHPSVTGGNNFTVQTQLEIARRFEEASEILTEMLFSVASISLLAGGVGIVNLLLVTVTHRRREIGIRLAVGATRSQIFMQFLTEAMLLNVLGGLGGILLGMGAAYGITAVLDWPTHISLGSILAGLLLSWMTGLCSGVYPAYKAACLNPIDALRYD